MYMNCTQTRQEWQSFGTMVFVIRTSVTHPLNRAAQSFQNDCLCMTLGIKQNIIFGRESI